MSTALFEIALIRALVDRVDVCDFHALAIKHAHLFVLRFTYFLLCNYIKRFYKYCKKQSCTIQSIWCFYNFVFVAKTSHFLYSWRSEVKHFFV